MNYENTRKIVLEAILEAVNKGLINGTSGNITMRDPENPNIVGTNEWIEGPYKPSSELPMHAAVLRSRPDVNATIHTHSMNATICAMGENPELRPITPPQCEFTPISIVSFTIPGSN